MNLSYVMSHMSRVRCDGSPMPTARDTDPPPASSPTMHSRQVHQTKKFFLLVWNQPIYPKTRKTFKS